MEEENVKEPLLEKKKKKYYENCPGCKVDKEKELSEGQGVPFTKLFIVWMLVLCAGMHFTLFSCIITSARVGSGFCDHGEVRIRPKWRRRCFRYTTDTDTRWKHAQHGVRRFLLGRKQPSFWIRRRRHVSLLGHAEKLEKKTLLSILKTSSLPH